jgi:hypothetical protein
VGSEVTRIPDSGGDQASLGQRGDRSPPNPSHLNPCSQHLVENVAVWHIRSKSIDTS